MTFSFAIRPVTAATTNTQPYCPSCKPKPIGVQIHMKKVPISCRMLSFMRLISSSATVRHSHSQLKLERNQMTMDDARMMVNAFLM